MLNLNKVIRVFSFKSLQKKGFAFDTYNRYKQIFFEKNTLEKFFPRSMNSSKDVAKYFQVTENSDIKMSNEPAIKALNSAIFHPSWRLIESGGKRWRPIYGSMIGKLLGVNIEKIGEKEKLLIDILSCVELLHTGSLILDDIADGSTMRRGIRCLHEEFGYGVGVNAGIDLLYYPFRQFFKERPEDTAKFMKDYVDELAWLFTGQSCDAAFQVGSLMSEESNFNEIAMCKTGLFPRLIVKMIFSSFCNDDNLRNKVIHITNILAVNIQITDDLLNIKESKNSGNKGVIGEDLTEGKITLMVMKTMSSADPKDANRLKEILMSKTRDQKVLLEGIKIMRDCGAIAYAEKRVNDHYLYVKERIEELKGLIDLNIHDSSAIQDLHDFNDYVIGRNV
jgi:geranylgeranyl diphosphate synthase, type I